MAPKTKKVVTIELDYQVYMQAEQDRLVETDRTGKTVHQKDFYAQIIEKQYTGKKNAKTKN